MPPKKAIKVTTKVASTPKNSPKKIVVSKKTSNLSGKSIEDLKTIMKDLGIKDSDVVGSGKNGSVLKKDRITAIQDFEAKQSKKDKISVKSLTKKKKSPHNRCIAKPYSFYNAMLTLV